MKWLAPAFRPDSAALTLRSVAQHGEDGRRIPQLDGIRGVAILMVFVSHAYRSQLLWSGVDLFFVLSGFLITGILLEQRGQHTLRRYLSGFYKRRARRILPPYILLMCLVSLLFGIRWVHHWYLFLFLTNTDSFFRIVRPYPLIILWSLAVEEQFYLIWPLAVYFLSEKARVASWTCLDRGAFVALHSHRGFSRSLADLYADSLPDGHAGGRRSGGPWLASLR